MASEEEEEEMKEEEEEEVQQEDEEEEEDEERKPLKSPPCPASQPLLIGSCPGFIETTVKIKQDDMLPGPKVCAVVCVLMSAYCNILKD